MQIDQVSAGGAEGAGGQAAGTATGMYYDNARFYDPVTGRFLNQDPMGYGAGDPDLYRFVGNDPTGATDPSGMDPNLGGGDVNAGGGSSGSSDLMNYVGRTWSATAPDAGDNGQGFSSDASGGSFSGISLSTLALLQTQRSISVGGNQPYGWALLPGGEQFMAASEATYNQITQRNAIVNQMAAENSQGYDWDAFAAELSNQVNGRTAGLAQAVTGAAGMVVTGSAAAASAPEAPPLALLLAAGTLEFSQITSDGVNQWLDGPGAVPGPSIGGQVETLGQAAGLQLPAGIGNFVDTAGQVSLVAVPAVQMGIAAGDLVTARLAANAAADSGVMGAAANKVPTLSSPYQVRIDPISGTGPMALDTTTFTSGAPTPNGGVRNAKQFWNAWSNIFPETLSESNLSLIQDGSSPVVDEHWLESFPEQSDYLDETLEHHHINQGPDAIPLPETLHRGAGNFNIWH